MNRKIEDPKAVIESLRHCWFIPANCAHDGCQESVSKKSSSVQWLFTVGACIITNITVRNI